MILDPSARNSTGSRGKSSQVPVNGGHTGVPRTCHAPEVRWGEELEMQDPAPNERQIARVF